MGGVLATASSESDSGAPATAAAAAATRGTATPSASDTDDGDRDNERLAAAHSFVHVYEVVHAAGGDSSPITKRLLRSINTLHEATIYLPPEMSARTAACLWDVLAWNIRMDTKGGGGTAGPTPSAPWVDAAIAVWEECRRANNRGTPIIFLWDATTAHGYCNCALCAKRAGGARKSA